MKKNVAKIESIIHDFLNEAYSNQIVNISLEDTNNTIKKIEKQFSKSILEKIKTMSSKNDLSISLSEEGELLIKNETISFLNIDLLSLNDDELQTVLSKKPSNICSDKSIIKSIVNKFHIKTKDIRKQSKLSLRKEEKQDELNTFFDYDKRMEIHQIISFYMIDAGEPFPSELLILNNEEFLQKYQESCGVLNNKLILTKKISIY